MRAVLPTLMLLMMTACAPPVPQACPQMCLEAADLYGGCVEEWGLDWPAVGYDDERAFLESCDTWAWEARLLTRDQPGWLAETCGERRRVFADPEAACEDYTSVDWSRIGPE